MRHSTITLTMDRYTHAFKSDEIEALGKLPDLSRAIDDAATDTRTDPIDPGVNLRGTAGVNPGGHPVENPGADQRGALRGAIGGKQWTQTTVPWNPRGQTSAGRLIQKLPDTPRNTANPRRKAGRERQCRHQDSNLEPRAYESLALTI